MEHIALALPMRVLVIESDPITTLGLRQLFAMAPSLQVCAEAATVAAAYAQWVQTAPEMAMIDPDLDGGGGSQLLRSLSRARPPVRCLAWLHAEDGSKVAAALRAGACGVIQRRESTEQLLEAIVMTALGVPYLSPQAGRLLAEGITQGALGSSVQPTELPGRQAQVFRLLGQGLAPREIAGRLGIALKTVQTHIFRARTQLRIQSQSELRRRAAMLVN